MFDFLFKKKKLNNSAHDLFSEVIAQSRLPAFYTDLNVEDSLDGRFDLMSLHMTMLLYKLDQHNQVEKVKKLKRMLQEIMFDNLDLTVREIGVGDLGVGKKIKTMAEAFYGRMMTYQNALESEDMAQMSDALKRNLYREKNVEDKILNGMLKYVFDQWRGITSQDIESIISGKIIFMKPEIN